MLSLFLPPTMKVVEQEAATRARGRQNVIFEMGYFYALIGRDRVSVLLRPDVEKASDVDGIAYKAFDDDRAWKTDFSANSNTQVLTLRRPTTCRDTGQVCNAQPAPSTY
jgi:predicted nucleotide-binding protein